MKKAYIISTGSELLNGSSEDTNAAFLSRELTAAGLIVTARETSGDSLESVTKAWKNGMERADLVISTGGLGPTSDDMTREGLSQALQLPLVAFPAELQKIQAYFDNRNREMPLNNKKQALFPEGSIIVPNNYGTAAGCIVNHGDQLLIMLPGPPAELQPMYSAEIVPLIHAWLGENRPVMVTRILRTIGLGESQIAEIIAPLADKISPEEIAYQAVQGEVLVKLSVIADCAQEASRILSDREASVRRLLGPSVYGQGDDTLAGVVIGLLQQANLCLSVAESCTGGLLGTMLTDIPGSSHSFWGGAITYSNEAKQKILGVNPDTLRQFGAVSNEVAREMSRGIRGLAQSDYGLAITGIAGPEGGTPEKPVGLVYLGLSDRSGNMSRELRLSGSRTMIRQRAARLALDWLRRRLEGIE